MDQMFSEFPSIEQFRTVIGSVKHYASRTSTSLPVIKFTGTVKLHGTNAGVGFHSPSTIWTQSRNRIITEEDDNLGFAKFINGPETTEHLTKIFTQLGYADCYLYGEWCGRGIQRNVAITNLDKMYVLFALKVKDTDTEGWRWLKDLELQETLAKFESPSLRIWSIYRYQTWEIEIDFNQPEKSLSRLQEITEEVERECPVAKAHGVSGTGEGVVWLNGTTKLCFKVKGEKHSVTKSKNLVAVDTEKIENLNKFVEYAVTEARLQQGLENIPSFDTKNLGLFIKWITQDIHKEESDTIKSNNFTVKEVNKAVTDQARKWYLAHLI